MQYLDSEITRLNDFLAAGITSTLNIFKAGLVFSVKDKGRNSNMDNNQSRIHVDDKYDVYFYHKLKGKTFTASGNNRGLANDYHLESNIDLIVFSKILNADQYFENRLNQFPTLKLFRTNFDSYRILEEETQNASEYNFNKMIIFSINYTLNMKMKKCQSL